MSKFWGVFFAVGCGDKGGATDTSPGLDADADTDTDSDTDTDADTDLLTYGPTVTTAEKCPLVPIVSLTAARPVSVTVSDGTHTASSPEALTHAVALFDFVPGVATTFSVEIVELTGETTTREVDWTPESLPSDQWPNVDVPVADAGKMSPGLTVLPVGTLFNPGWHYLVAFDEEGLVHWLYEGETQFDDFEITQEGNILYLDGAGITEMDWACQPINQFTWEDNDDGVGSVVPDTILFHHEVSKLSDGTYLVLDHEKLEFASFPVEYQDLGNLEDADVDVSVLIRFDSSGTVLERLSFADVFDPSRIGWDSLNTGEAYPTAYDWVHGNSAQWVESENAYLLSARQQDAVALYDRDTSTVSWVLGNPENWSPEFEALRLVADGSVDWFYHQHAATLNEDGTLTLFDNGNVRVSPPDVPSGLPYSRAVQYRVDGNNVSQDWEFVQTSEGEVFCAAGGDVDTLPNGNVLSSCAFGKSLDGEDHTDAGFGDSCARVSEFDPVTGTPVFELMLTSDVSDNPNGWFTVRSARVEHVGP